MSGQVAAVSASEDLKKDKRFRFFRKLITLPYLLALLGLFLPLMTVSCAERPIAEPSFYEIATGLDLHESLQEPAKGYLEKMEKGNPKSLDKFKVAFPGFPHLEPMPMLFAIAGAILLAAMFALFTPLGSIAMGMLSMVALWSFLSQIARLCANSGMQLLQVGPGVGIYAASALILIGTAMNLAAIIRPMLLEMKAKKKAREAKSKG